MIGKLSVDGFRGLDGLETGPLARFNLIVGPGGSGKTSLLEAAFLLSGNGHPVLLLGLFDLRGIAFGNRSAEEVEQLFLRTFSPGSKTPSFQVRGTWGDREGRQEVRLVAADVTPLASQPLVPGVRLPAVEIDRAIEQSVARVEMESCWNGGREVGTFFVTPKGIVPRQSKSEMAFAVRFVNSRGLDLEASKWTLVEDRGEGEHVLDLLRTLDPEVRAVSVGASAANEAYIRVTHVRLGAMLPVLLGQGFARALGLATALVAAAGGAMLVDEIDASLHVGALRTFVRFLRAGARRLNVQVFCTTHSLEAIDTFIDLCEPLSDLRVLQMSRAGGPERLRNLSGDEARSFREEIGLDLRKTP